MVQGCKNGDVLESGFADHADRRRVCGIYRPVLISQVVSHTSGGDGSNTSELPPLVCAL